MAVAIAAMSPMGSVAAKGPGAMGAIAPRGIAAAAPGSKPIPPQTSTHTFAGPRLEGRMESMRVYKAAAGKGLRCDLQLSDGTWLINTTITAAKARLLQATGGPAGDVNCDPTA